MKSLKVSLIIVILFAGCWIRQADNSDKPRNGDEIRVLVEKAISGDTLANDSLSGLINLFYPVNKNYNSLNIDSIVTVSGQVLYTVLLEYPNPIYNKFAVYDENLSAYILDNSLNGNISFSSIFLNGDKYVEIIEHFYSKNHLRLSRISLYKLFPKSIKLVYRAFSKLNEPGNEYYQQIVELSPDRIRTSINSKNNSSMMNKGDIYLWSTARNRYVSHDSIFYKFIINQIKQSKGKSGKKEISSEKDALKSVGIITGDDHQKDFTLDLSGDWKELDNLKISLNSNTETKGIRFINANLGASISVVKLKPGDNAERIINNSLIHRQGGKNNLRSSREIISGKNVLQFWEYSCPAKKYIMILEASKYTFDKYRSLYQDIIKSFDTEC